MIELQLHLGKRGAALEAYQTCQAMLFQELGLAPDAQTRALIEHLHEPELMPVIPVMLPTPATMGSLQLIGRTEIWHKMEAAWNAGQHIFIAGEAGAGKSRLMFEYAKTKGAFVQQFGRPGDQVVPFSSITRSLRHALQTHPKLELPAWAQRELSRLIPDQSDEPLLPLSSKEDRLSLFDAVSRVFEELRKLVCTRSATTSSFLTTRAWN